MGLQPRFWASFLCILIITRKIARALQRETHYLNIVLTVIREERKYKVLCVFLSSHNDAPLVPHIVQRYKGTYAIAKRHMALPKILPAKHGSPPVMACKGGKILQPWYRVVVEKVIEALVNVVSTVLLLYQQLDNIYDHTQLFVLVAATNRG
jgi:hypothetical protein